jgi:hypothetical protein
MSWPAKYRKSMCADLIKMMSNGDSLEECGAVFGCSRNAILKWAADPRKPEFKEALDFGRTLSEAWWMRLGRRGMVGEIKSWNAVSWIFTMKCRFHWKETLVIETMESIKMLTPAELDKRLADYQSVLLAKPAPSVSGVIECSYTKETEQQEAKNDGN